MKREYVKPVMMGEAFVANEYVAACYHVHCITPNNNAKMKALYNDSNGNGQLDSNDEVLYRPWTSFSGCNEVHKGVLTEDDIKVNGFLVDRSGNSYGVFWWYDRRTGYHSTIPEEQYYEVYPERPNAS